MKAFLAAIVFIAVVAVGADMALNQAGYSSEEVFKSENVRLPVRDAAEQTAGN